MAQKPTCEELKDRIAATASSFRNHGLVITGNEITENALKESETIFRQIFECSRDGFFLVNLQGRITLANQAFCDMLGYSLDELQAMENFYQITPERWHKREKDEIWNNQLLHKGFSGIYEKEYIHKNGNVFPVELQLYAVFDSNSDVSCLWGVARDITNRNRIEDVLRESETLFRNLIDNAPEGIFVQAEGRFVFLNPAMAQIFGADSAEELVGTDLMARIAPEHHETVRKRIRFQQETGKSSALMDQVYLRVDGSRITVETTAVAIQYQGVDAHLVFVRDITERKKQEETLRLQSLVLDQIYDHVTITDLDGKISYVNQAVAKSLGYSKETLIGKFTHVYGEDSIESIAQKEIVEKTLRKGTWRGEVVNFDKSGRKHIMDCRTQVVFDESGSPVALCGIATDISDDIKFQKALIESEERFRTIFEQAAVGVARVSPDGVLLEINDKFSQLVGYTKEELHQITFQEITHPDDLQLDEKHVEQVLAGKMDSFEIEKRYIHKNGQPVWVRLHSNVVREKDGDIKYAIAVVTDISERKLLEEEKEKLQKQLNHAQKLESIGNLAGGIAHDFNNILFPIVGMAEMLLEDLPEGSIEKENAEEIYKAGRRGSDLVKQILAFSRQTERKKMPIQLQHILKDVLKLIRSTIPSDIKITQNIQHDCSMVMADPTQIHQIAMNLITNAYHAVETKSGEISVKLREIEIEFGHHESNILSGSYAMLSVSDTGDGIDPVIRDKIFEPYFTTKEQGKGTGLGLAVVYGIVKEHQGDIKVYSELGKGTTFHVYLPVMTKDEMPAPIEIKAELATGHEHILLVDDENAIAILEKKMLERRNYSAFC